MKETVVHYYEILHLVMNSELIKGGWTKAQIRYSEKVSDRKRGRWTDRMNKES